MKTEATKHVTFEEEASPVSKGLARVGAAVETSVDAVAMAGSKVASIVPGTAEHALKKGAKALKATGDVHVANGENSLSLD